MIVYQLLQYSVNIKLYHWATLCFARHMASCKLVDAITELTDKFVEVYTGIYGRKEVLGNESVPIELKPLSDKEVIQILTGFVRFLSEEIPKHCGQHTDLLNIRDEMLSEVNKALYLFSLS